MTKLENIFEETLNESSLSRILQHINNPDMEFGVISPFRKDVEPAENQKRYAELISILKKMNYGFIAMRGGYQEETGFVNEKSLFIPKISRQEIINLGQKYDQWSVIHKDLKNFVEIGSNENSGIGKILSKFDIPKNKESIDLGAYDLFKDFFSKLEKGSHRGKKFLFKMQEQVQTSLYTSLKRKKSMKGDMWQDIFEETLNESSLSRVWRQTQKYQSGTITAFRYAENCGDGKVYTKSENKKRNKILLSKLLKKGYSVTKVKGTYIENFGSSEAREVSEESFLVVDILDKKQLKQDLVSLGTEFEQDSITFSLPSGEYYLISSNTCPMGYPGEGKIGVEMKLGKSMFGKTGEFHSKVNGRPFVFESILSESLVLNKMSIPEIRSYTHWSKQGAS